MIEDRDHLLNVAEQLAGKLAHIQRKGFEWVDHNEFGKAVRYLLQHANAPDPYGKLLKLVGQQFPRSKPDWRCMRDVFTEQQRTLSRYSPGQLAFIFGWAARILQYKSKSTPAHKARSRR